LCALAGCGGDGGPGAPASALHDDAVTIGSFDFPESVLLAEVYGQALEAEGYAVRLDLNVGPRDLVEPALAAGLLEFVPEYAGSAVQFLSLGAEQPSDRIAATRTALTRTLDPGRLVALTPAPAQNANAVVVTRATADRYHLADISDLAARAPRLTFGGPPGCQRRPFCLQGISETYGLRFGSFMALDVAGPLTRQALAGGHVDVGLLFTTDALIEREGLVVLRDDRSLQPAENVTPVVRREVVDRWGARFTQAVDAVSARLTTPVLQRLNAEVAAGRPARAVAAAWLAREGLV
jgi:osmoprotectant transport system substrate-binding protein